MNAPAADHPTTQAHDDDAVLLLAHGTISELSELPEFLRNVRRGRPPPPELIQDMEHRYRTIGGSPLLAATRHQALLLEACSGWRTFVAMRLWRPTVDMVLPQIAAAGARRVCLLPLAPFSVQVYADAARRAQRQVPGPGRELELVSVPAWGTHPRYLCAHVEHIRRHLPPAPFALVLTAHSLPLPVIEAGDRYAHEVEQCAAAISARLAIATHLAYQSHGPEGRWLGPDLKATLQQLAAGGAKHVVVAPFGFLSEHVETLYDLDVEAAGWCRELGMGWTRVPALGDDPQLIAALRELVAETLA